ncbi:MAG: C40 family peptidase [Mucilaginibacter sp.]
MKRYITLISLLLLCVVFAVAAHPHRTHRHAHKIRVKVPVFCLNNATDTISSYNLLYFAQSLIGTPYRAASSDPSRGFDCSGFVSYVFKSFNSNVPRSSGDYSNLGREINIEDARQGDIILFTGTKTHHPHSIGHVGIVYSNEANKLTFIHSTSGKENCVTISAMDDTYKRRFVKVVRILRQNDIFQAQLN